MSQEFVVQQIARKDVTYLLRMRVGACLSQSPTKFFTDTSVVLGKSLRRAAMEKDKNIQVLIFPLLEMNMLLQPHC